MFDFSNIKSEDSYITKDFVLSKLSDQQIIEYYLNIKLQYSNLISSPFRRDRNPSFGIKYVGDKFIAKDFSTNETFDCFSIVQKLYNCNFQEALKIISNDFRLTDVTTNTNMMMLFNSSDSIKSTVKKNIITIEKQDYTQLDKDYWGQYQIDTDTLKLFDVYSCKYVWLNGSLCRIYNYKNPVYAYEFHQSYKIYCPLSQNKKTKWLFSGNKNDIEGYNYFKTSCFINLSQKFTSENMLIITKSLKDVMCLYKLGYQSISLQGETNLLSNKMYQELKELGIETIYSLYDNDKPGKQGTEYLKSYYQDIIPLFVPDEYGVKDISDFIKTYGLNDAQVLIDSLL
jgi:hypothetical protein